METLFGIPIGTLTAALTVVFLVAAAVTAWFVLRNPVVLKMAVRNIPRRRAQTVLIVAGLMLATLLFSASFATGDTLAHSVRVFVVKQMGHLDEAVFSNEQDASGRPAFIPAETADAVRSALDGAPVDGVMPAISLAAPAIALASERSVPRLQVHGLDAQYVGGFGAYLDADGNELDLGALGQNELYLSADAADDLGAEPGGRLALFFDEAPVTVRVAGVFDEGGSTSSSFPLSVMRLADMQALLGEQGNINYVFISNEGGTVAGERHTEAVLDAFEDLREERGLDYDDVKRDGIELADNAGDQFASLFLLFGTFSIIAGILLIALIFVMLAAERKRELGIARAVGAQRGHIVRLFTFEGAVYSLAAAAVGSVLGIVIGIVMVRIMAVAFSTIDDLAGFEIAFSFRWQSLLLAYTLGMVVTYVVVIVSAARVSALNIVRAVRDIPEPPGQGRRLRESWRAVGAAYLDGLRALRRLRPLRALRRLLLSGPCAVVRLMWALFMAGYLMVALGVLLALNGILAEELSMFAIGLSLVVVGVPLALNHAARLPERVAYTAAGVLIVLLWLLPIDWEDYGLPRFNAGIEIFILSGVIVVIGAVWVVVYNAGSLSNLITAVAGRGRTLSPIVRTAMAYPMANRFRTGMTLAMFSLVIFTLSVLGFVDAALDKAYEDTRQFSGGFDVTANASFTNPVGDLAARVEESPALDAGEFAAIGAMSGLPVRIRQQDTGQELQDWFVTGVDAAYAEATTYGFDLRDERYPDDRAVWRALAAGEEVAVVSAAMVPAATDFEQGGPDFSFQLEGFQRDGDVLPEVYVEVYDSAEQQMARLRVIGVMKESAFFARTVTTGHGTLQRLAPVELPYLNYEIVLNDPSRAEAVAAALEEEFVEHGVQASSLAKTVRDFTALNRTFSRLVQGFMGLGLVVGIAALGVIAARSVVERRVQIGILRAIGFRSGMVQLAFLVESSFIALLGIVVGLGLGFGLSIDIIREVGESFENVTYAIPWETVILVIVVAYGASLLTTYLPARQASNIYPAEALRYDE
ncbi:MAG: FtsX-like permease family protein [Chloroflexi bacterium]|nr:FtsX-like permease family protein [Chloroflexota bacterium]